VGLLLTHAALAAWSATLHTPSNDEVAHLPAGVSHWQWGRFDLYNVNPPLVRLLAALPVVLARPATDWKSFDAASRSEWAVGSDFIAVNGERSWRLFTLARWACVPLSLLGAWVCYRWAGELYGRWAGLLALALWCFGPNLLAHAQLITPDAGAASLGVAAGYCFWRWLRQPTWGRTVAAGLLLGLAELSKMTWVILFALWPLLWALWRVRGAAPPAARNWLRQALQLAVILLLGLWLINVGYAFEGSFQRLEDFRFSSAALSGPGAEDRGNRFAGTWLGAAPVPLPKNYLLGLDVQKVDFEKTLPSYLRGEWRFGGGWWYYYLYALAVKVPLGTLLLLLLAAGCRLWARPPSASLADEVVLLAPGAAVLVLVSSQTGINHHLRYVLPAFPFAIVWASQVLGPAVRAGRAVRVAVASLLAWSVASSLSAYPHSLSYFNELAGGPAGGPAHLLNSNIDWGQDLFFLKRWQQDHPEAADLRLACDGRVSPSAVGIRWAPAPAAPAPGWYAVSVNRLKGVEGRYRFFLRFRPVARAGYSIYIYHLTAAEAGSARREVGLPPLSEAPPR
jgi:4-amino-4-deoxy-L-arabinose transferase-like glycosyltransferase